MKTNTSKYLPFECISPNLFKNPETPDYPYVFGTGFFCNFPPYEYIFYVTAKHCVEINNENELKAELKISYSDKSSEEPPKAIVFSELFLSTEDEDIIISVVDNNVNHEELKILKKRAVTLWNQNDVKKIIQMLCDEEGNIRTIGFSQPNNDDTYDEHTKITYEEKQQLVAVPRGFYGKITDTSDFKGRYGFEKSNWKGEEYRGFSGSPVFSLITNGITPPKVTVIGVMLTATKSRGEFLSINVVTNLISHYIYDLLNNK